MKSNALEKFTHKSVSSIFFVQIPLAIRRIVRISDGDHFFWKLSGGVVASKVD